jgi:glutathione S-transferase
MSAAAPFSHIRLAFFLEPIPQKWKFHLRKDLASKKGRVVPPSFRHIRLRDLKQGKSMYRLHCFAQSGNCYKVALMLALTGLPWEPVFVDFFKGETRGERYRSKVNELGEAPVLETDGKRISQSGVILDLLARETGKFAPGDGDERAECWRWILFDNHKFTGYLSVYRFLRTFVKDTDPAVLAFLKARAERAFAIADKHFSNHAFLLGDRPTIADISMAGYVFYPVEETGFDFKASYPAIDAWRERIKALPGWKHPYDLMPGHPLPG